MENSRKYNNWEECGENCKIRDFYYPLAIHNVAHPLAFA